MEQQKDYSLLRPFDLEAAKRGDGVISIYHPEREGIFVGGPDCNGIIVLDRKPLGFSFWGPTEQTESLRMVPLCWVEGRPVYKGDVLHSRFFQGMPGCANGLFEVTGFEDGQFRAGKISDIHATKVSSCTWTPPKVGCEVKLLGWFDGDQFFWLRDGAEPQWPSKRVPSEDRVIKIEEPAGPEGGAR